MRLYLGRVFCENGKEFGFSFTPLGVEPPQAAAEEAALAFSKWKGWGRIERVVVEWLDVDDE